MNRANQALLGVAGVVATTLATPLYALPSPVDGGAIVSGDYDDFLVGFDPTTLTVTGYFDEMIGGPPGPTFNCTVFLSGKLRGSSADILAQFDGAPPGHLTKGQLLRETPSKIRIRLESEDSGCVQQGHFADDDRPAEFSLRTQRPWTSIAVVKSAKAYFFDAPASASRRKAYLVKGDGVGVRASQPGWLQVDFVGGKKVSSGWIRQLDVYPSGHWPWP